MTILRLDLLFRRTYSTWTQTCDYEFRPWTRPEMVLGVASSIQVLERKTVHMSALLKEVL